MQISDLIALIVERLFKHYVSTILAVLTALGGTLPYWTSFVPARYVPAVSTAAALCGSVALALAKYTNTPPKA